MKGPARTVHIFLHKIMHMRQIICFKTCSCFAADEVVLYRIKYYYLALKLGCKGTPKNIYRCNLRLTYFYMHALHTSETNCLITGF